MNKSNLQYFGSIEFIKSILHSSNVSFDLSQPYSKMSFINRMVIGTAQGPLDLSIPIVGGRDQKSLLRDIKIAYQIPWQEQHFKALVSSYQRAPYFEYYKEELFLLYQSKPIYLSDFLLEIHAWLRKQIKGKWEFTILTNSIPIQDSMPDNKFMDLELPKNYHLIANPIVYQQVFEDRIGFLPNLCILDLLFCCGGKQANYLLSI